MFTALPKARRTIIKNNTLLLILLFLLLSDLFSGMSIAVAGEEIEQQRQQFIEAKKYLRAGKLNSFKYLATKLRSYPLYPYLTYDYLRPRLWKITDKEVIGFLKRYGDLPMADDLRSSWLKVLARRNHWQTFLDNYTPQKDKTLQCYQLQARIKTNNYAYLLEDTRSVWLDGNSLPPECDPAFIRLYKSELMTSELVWDRIRLAMANGQTSLAAYLSRRLDETGQKWVSRWIAMYHNPARGTDKPNYEDIPIAGEILAFGIQRLAKQNINNAIAHWYDLKNRYHFTEQQISDIEQTLAMHAAFNRHDMAKDLLESIDNALVNEKIFDWRLRNALDNLDWKALVKWTDGPIPNEDIKTQWLYWRARALTESGNRSAADGIFRELSQERDYYGFLAADRTGTNYRMNHHSLPEDIEGWQRVTQKPAIVRARELYLVGMTYSARREWFHALNDMTSYQMQIAAAIATNWGWHDRTILTLGKAGAYDDLILRFPLPYKEKLQTNIIKRNLDESWVYALVRAESAFMPDARSPAGALGLMQVMPATGKITARNMGWKNFKSNNLLEIDKNIEIGTTYLKQMHERFNNNLILATAAYNAGPANVKKWLPETECIEPDIWIEKIPFNETRKYVRRILYYASIYDWRLQQQITPVRQRMALVKPDNANMIADLACPTQQISQN